MFWDLLVDAEDSRGTFGDGTPVHPVSQITNACARSQFLRCRCFVSRSVVEKFCRREASCPMRKIIGGRIYDGKAFYAVNLDALSDFQSQELQGQNS